MMPKNLDTPKSLFDNTFENIQMYLLPLNFKDFLRKNLGLESLAIRSIMIDMSSCCITTTDAKELTFFRKDEIAHENEFHVEINEFLYVCIGIGSFLYQYRYRIMSAAGGFTEWLKDVSVYRKSKTDSEIKLNGKQYVLLKKYSNVKDYFPLSDIYKDLKIKG